MIEVLESTNNTIKENKESTAHGFTRDELSKLAETVGSTIDREPIDIEKEKRAFRAFQRKMDSLD